jgi:hypothetical protein
MYLLFDLKYLRHLKCVNYLYQYEYDLPIQFQTYKNYLQAITTGRSSRHEILFDYSEVINDAIKNNERPAIIVRKLTDLGLRYISFEHPNVVQYDCFELTTELAQEIINANIAAISNLNQYFIDYVLISQINATV